MAQDSVGPVRGDELTDDDLDCIVVLAKLVASNIEPRLPVNFMFNALALGVLELRRRLDSTIGKAA